MSTENETKEAKDYFAEIYKAYTQLAGMSLQEVLARAELYYEMEAATEESKKGKNTFDQMKFRIASKDRIMEGTFSDLITAVSITLLSSIRPMGHVVERGKLTEVDNEKPIVKEGE